MKTLLILIRPWRVTPGERVNVRVGDSPSPEGYGLGGFASPGWEPALVSRPVLSMELMTPDMSARVQTGSVRFAVKLENLTAIPDALKLEWQGAPVEIYSADDLSYSRRRLEFLGYVSTARPDLDSGIIQLDAEASVKPIERNLLRLEYSGAGNLDGTAELRGTLRPAGFGACEHIEPVWFDDVNNIGQIDGYSNTIAITRLMEGASDMGASVGDYANYAALKQAIIDKAIPRGRWGTCIAEGLVGLGAPPAGVIGVNATFGGGKPGSMMLRILYQHAQLDGAVIEDQSFDDLTTLVEAAVGGAANVHYWTKEQRQCRDLLESIAASCNASLLITFQGVFAVTRAVAEPGAVIATLDRGGSIEPRVINWRSADRSSPFYELKARAARPGRVLTRDEVLFEDDFDPQGVYDAATVYRQGDTIYTTDGAEYLYINVTAGAGHTPPAATYPPADPAADAYWQQLRPGNAYADGTPIDALKPQEAGSNKTETRTAASIVGQGALATANQAAYGSQISGLPAAIQPANILAGGRLDAGQMQYGPGGPLIQSLQPAEAGANITATHTAAAIAGQGALATANSAAYATQISGLPTALIPANLDSGRIVAGNVVYTGGPGTATIQSLRPGEAGANVTETRTAASITGQGSLATANSANFATQVSNLPYSLSAFDGGGNIYAGRVVYNSGTLVFALEPQEANSNRTETRTAAAITGQGALATQSAVAWATQVTGSTRPADNAGTSDLLVAIGTFSTVRGNTVAKSGGTHGAYQGGARGKPIRGPQMVSSSILSPVNGESWYTHIGLDTDATNFNAIGGSVKASALYIAGAGSGTVYIYVGGVQRASSAVAGVTEASRLWLQYDETGYRAGVDGTSVTYASSDPTLTLYPKIFDFYNSGGYPGTITPIYDIIYGPMSTRPMLGAAGTIFRETGALLTDSAAVTSLGTASAIAGQGALATVNAADFATQVTGTGKPDLFASALDNLVMNSTLATGSTSWSPSGTRTAAANGDPADFIWRCTADGSGPVLNGGGTVRIPGGATKLHRSVWIRSSNAACFTYFFAYFYNAIGGFISALSDIQFAGSANVWRRAVFNVGAVPANAAAVYFAMSCSHNGYASGFYFDYALPRGATSELGSTVGATAGLNTFRADGVTVLTQAEIRTAEGTSAAITGQGALATLSSASWDTQISGRPLERLFAENLLDMSGWKLGGSVTTGQFTDPINGANDSYAVVTGPDGGAEVVFKAVGAAATGAFDGGWTAATVDTADGFDPVNPYLMAAWVMRPAFRVDGVTATTGYAYFGLSGTTTQRWNGSAWVADGNPYWMSGTFPDNGGTSDRGKWYLWVGLLNSSGFTGTTDTISGIWDPRTGQRIYASPYLFRATAGSTSQQHRLFQYPGVDGNIMYFARPLVAVAHNPGQQIRQMLATVGAVAGSNTYRSDGTTVMSQAEIRTAEGTSAAIAGQGAFATLNSVSLEDNTRITNKTRISKLDATTGRVSDPTMYHTGLLLGVTNTTNLSPSYTASGSNWTVSLPAHVRKITGTSGAVSLSYGAASGTVAASTFWYAYLIDVGLTGNASPTVTFTTNMDDMLVPGAYMVSAGYSPAVGTPDPPPPGTGGGGGGGGGRYGDIPEAI